MNPLAEPASMTGVEIADGRHCLAWALPGDGTCALAARRLTTQALRAMRLPDDLVDDAVLAVGELAANVYRHVLGAPGDRPRRDIATELWLYRRLGGPHGQIVCKVFDAQRQWSHHRGPRSDDTGDDLQESGRGLLLVEAISSEWGRHPTRSRVGWSIPGKAVWFALPLPPALAIAHPAADLSPANAAHRLRSALHDRGITNVIHRDTGDQSVLSVRHGLTVWCRGEHFTWTIDGDRTSRPFDDLTDVAEQLVRLHEEMADHRRPPAYGWSRSDE
ncbi:MAG TPA: ATP-binding protein [Thermopolyspora sp.]